MNISTQKTVFLVVLSAAVSFGPIDKVLAAEVAQNSQAADSASTTPAPLSPDTEVTAARLRVESALGVFARVLTEQLPVESELSESLYSYLEANPEFFGSALALIGTDGKVTHSPYVYRSSSGFAETDLAVPEYGINDQAWFRAPVDTKAPVWTAPYFDAGGGDIWMVTRSVPLIRAGVVVGVVTTDLPVPAP